MICAETVVAFPITSQSKHKKYQIHFLLFVPTVSQTGATKPVGQIFTSFRDINQTVDVLEYKNTNGGGKLVQSEFIKYLLLYFSS